MEPKICHDAGKEQGSQKRVILIKADESQECLYRRRKLAPIPRRSEAVRVNMLSIKICSNTAPVIARAGRVFARAILHETSEV